MQTLAYPVATPTYEKTKLLLGVDTETGRPVYLLTDYNDTNTPVHAYAIGLASGVALLVKQPRVKREAAR